MHILPIIINQFVKNSAWIALIFVTIIFLVTLRGVSGNLYPENFKRDLIKENIPPFETSMERGRYVQIIGISRDKSFTADKYADFLEPDIAWYNGHYRAIFPIGVALVSSPFFIIGQFFNLSQVFSYLPTAIFAILTCFVIFKICNELNLSKRAAIISLISFALASSAWSYAVSLSAHTLSAFIVSIAFYLYLKIQKNNKNNFIYFFILWLIYSLNFFIDYPNLFILLPIMIFSIIKVLEIKKIKDEIKFKIPLVVLYSSVSLVFIMSLFIAYNLYIYNKPIAFTNKYNLKVFEISGIDIDRSKLNNDIFTLHNYSSRFTPTSLLKGAEVLTVSQDRGIFFYFPVFIFSILGFFLAIKKKKMWAVIVALTFLADIIIYGSFDDPWGGWAFGPRYLIPVVPLLSVLIGYIFYNKVFKSIILKLIFSSALLISICISAIGALTTNAVPPSIEAIYINLDSNYLFNINYLLDLGTSSFFYNQSLLKLHINDFQFYAWLIFIVSIFTLLIIWFPKIYENKN